MLRGYSFEPMPNSRALATAGLFMTIGLQKKWILAFENQIWRGKIILARPAVRAAVIQWFGVESFCPKVGSRDSSFVQTKSIRPKRICRSLSLKKGNKHRKTVTAHVESNGN